MVYFFGTVTFLYLFEVIFLLVKTKRLFSLINLCLISVVFPFSLYLLDWSSYCAPCSWISYYVVSVFEICIMLLQVLFVKFEKPNSRPSFRIKNILFHGITIKWSYLCLLLGLVLSAIENIFYSGSLFPFLQGIDVHVSVMPIVGPFLDAFLPLSFVISYLEWKQSKDKVLIPLFLLTVAYQLLGSGSRMNFLIEMLILASFILFYEGIDKEKTSSALIGILVVFSVFLVAVVYIAGEGRIGDAQYSSLILYSGPFKGTAFGEVISWYYGYFVLSYRNLDLSLVNVFESNLYTSGRLFFYPFTDLVKLSYFLPYKGEDLQNSVRVVTIGAATVPTAFLYCFSDFGYLFFVTPCFYMVSMWLARRKASFWALCYASFLAVVFFFFSFLDEFQNGIPLYFSLLAFLTQCVFLEKKEYGAIEMEEIVL